FRLTGVDPRGQGASTACAAPDDYDAEVMTADLLAVLNSLGLERPLIGGHSRGSRLAIEFAIRYPERVSAVAAVCVPALGGTAGRDARYRASAQLLRERGLEAFIAGSRTAPRNPERRRVWADHLRRAGLDALCAQYEALARRDFLGDRMADYRVPTLVVTGERDHLREDCETLARSVPGLRLVIVPNAAHAPMTENRDAYYAAVLPFLQAHAPSAAEV
ncbi:MAG TPA: alpha/beta fold hydrolase, partial [Dehalococcoidia bacterium]|nr:alpha/beta fold hydrolase [Dehalococcoidia bacterium]